jgi:hypothetical protein
MLPQPEAVFRIMSLPLAISGDVAGPRESHSLRARRALIAARLGQDELNHSKSWPCGHKSAARVSIGDQLGHVAAAKWRAMGHEETSIVRLNVMQLSRWAVMAAVELLLEYHVWVRRTGRCRLIAGH